MANFENLPSTNTPLNAENLNKLLGYRETLANNTDLDNVVETGIYYTADSTLSNAGTNYNWSYLIVISNGSLIHQYIIKPYQKFMIMREYSGYPATWKDWKQVTEADSGWQTVPVISPVTSSSSEPLKCRKINNIVYVFGFIEYNSTLNWGTMLAQLPVGFRPFQENDFCCRTVDENTVTVIAVGNDGGIRYLYSEGTGSGGTGCVISCSFIADN